MPESTASSAQALTGVPAPGTGIPGLVWAYRFRADGSAEGLRAPVDPALPSTVPGDGGWLRLHVALSDQRAGEFIALSA